MLFGLGWPWWSARADNREVASARPVPAALRRKSRRVGERLLPFNAAWGFEPKVTGRAGFSDFMEAPLG
jgi:hypothetical protein